MAHNYIGSCQGGPLDTQRLTSNETSCRGYTWYDGYWLYNIVADQPAQSAQEVTGSEPAAPVVERDPLAMGAPCASCGGTLVHYADCKFPGPTFDVGRTDCIEIDIRPASPDFQRYAGVCKGGPDSGATWDHDKPRISYYQSPEAHEPSTDADRLLGVYVFVKGPSPHWEWQPTADMGNVAAAEPASPAYEADDAMLAVHWRSAEAHAHLNSLHSACSASWAELAEYYRTQAVGCERRADAAAKEKAKRPSHHREMLLRMARMLATGFQGPIVIMDGELRFLHGLVLEKLKEIKK